MPRVKRRYLLLALAIFVVADLVGNYPAGGIQIVSNGCQIP